MPYGDKAGPVAVKGLRRVVINPFVDWVLGTISNPTEHDGETQAKKFYHQIWG
jgi:hypothetical protein